MPQDHYLLIGTYTGGKSTGIHVYKFDEQTGKAQMVDSVKTDNPSYLAVSPNQKFVYAVNETKRGDFSGMVRAFAFDKKTGKLRLINEQPSVGDNPCYIVVDKTGKWIIVANYTSGTFAVLPVHEDGSVGAAVSSVQHHGHGTNPARQEGPHVHSTVLSPDNRFLFVQDLGLDKIFQYSFDAQSGAVKAKDSVKLADGSGPRHLVFHPNGKWAYLVQEMGGTVTVFDYSGAKLKAVQTISTLPAGFNQSFTSADVHVSPDGKFLYASNRDASNTIAIYAINQANGKLRLLGHQSTLGKTPRNFNFDPSGRYLLVANQNSNDVVIFKRDKKTGKLQDTGQRIDVGNPVCVQWIEKD